MKTLYNRLSKENVKKMNSNMKPFQNTLFEITTSLKNNISYCDMKFADAIALFDAIYPNKLFDLTLFQDLFSND